MIYDKTKKVTTSRDIYNLCFNSNSELDFDKIDSFNFNLFNYGEQDKIRLVASIFLKIDFFEKVIYKFK